MTYTLYRGPSNVVGTFRNLEAAMVATGIIGCRFERLNDTQWISLDGGAVRFLIETQDEGGVNGRAG